MFQEQALRVHFAFQKQKQRTRKVVLLAGTLIKIAPFYSLSVAKCEDEESSQTKEAHFETVSLWLKPNFTANVARVFCEFSTIDDKIKKTGSVVTLVIQ